VKRALLAVALTAIVETPVSADTTVSCAEMVAGHLDQGAEALTVAGVHISTRGTFGFTSFTMSDRYQIEDEPLHTAAAAPRATFAVHRSSDGTSFTGRFHEVFPDRGNGDEDLGEIQLRRDGTVWLRSIRWGGDAASLGHVVCRKGLAGQHVVTARNSWGTYGGDYWSLVVTRAPAR
jgi:hypothetical protein